MDHKFHAKTFTVSVLSTLFFSGLITAAYLDLQLCPYNTRHSSASSATSIFDPNYRVFPCNFIDPVVWIYIMCYIVFMSHKLYIYKGVGQHFFLLDFCYLLNNLLICLLMYSTVEVINPNSNNSNGIAVFSTGYRVEIHPFSHALSSMTPSQRDTYMFCFSAIFGGSVGPLLGAIWIWNNGLVFHSIDKCTSCFLHLMPSVVQLLLLNGELVANKTESSHHQLILDSLSYKNLVVNHFAMFLGWQVIYHVVYELRALRREHKAKKLVAMQRMSGVTEVQTSNLTMRVTSFSFMWDLYSKQPKSPVYKFLTFLGTEQYKCKMMFSILQALVHLVCLSVAYIPIYFSTKFWDLWPLLAYVAFFFAFAVRNSGLLLKRWIQKLEAKAEQASAHHPTTARSQSALVDSSEPSVEPPARKSIGSKKSK